MYSKELGFPIFFFKISNRNSTDTEALQTESNKWSWCGLVVHFNLLGVTTHYELRHFDYVRYLFNHN